jgi:hypothetical protein
MEEIPSAVRTLPGFFLALETFPSPLEPKFRMQQESVNQFDRSFRLFFTITPNQLFYLAFLPAKQSCFLPRRAQIALLLKILRNSRTQLIQIKREFRAP